MISDNIILNMFFVGKSKRFTRNFNKKLTDEIKLYLENRFIDNFYSYKESIFRIKYNIENLPKCPVCSKYIHLDKHNNFRTYCSYKCINLDENIKNKIKCTKFEKYGNENYVNVEKRIQTNLKKYGCKFSFSAKEVRQKCYNTKLKKYNNKYFCNQKKSEETCLEKYGVKTPLHLKSTHEKSKQTFLLKYGVEKPLQSNIFMDKFKNTCLEKYGSEYPIYCKEIYNKIDYKKIHEKAMLTKRKNHTFKDSKKEKESYNILKEKFNDLDYQYKSKEYPFYCDFYIPSLNLYIECNYHWTHGGHPYNESNIEDNKIVEIWKSKNSKYYDNAIECWTKRDVNKRNIAKQNNLNYIEFWNINELKEFINNI